MAPQPGLLRVTRVIKGSAPGTLLVPLPDPCLFFFQKVGERLIVSSPSTKQQASPLSRGIVESLRRRKIGKWDNVR
jgi:hypothetical protein